MPRVGERLISEPAGKRPVSDDGYRVSLAAHYPLRRKQAKRGGNGGGRVSCVKSVMRAFACFGKTRNT